MIKNFKLFETNNSYYLTDYLTRDELKDKIIPMSKRHRETIQDMVSLYYTITYDHKDNRGGPILKLINKTSSMAPSIDIVELSDEWFFITLWYRDRQQLLYYKCDQINGVRDLLKDKFII